MYRSLSTNTFKSLKGIGIAPLLASLLVVASACTVNVRLPMRPASNGTNDLSISSVTITNTLNTSYVNTTSLSLTYSVSGSYTDYCILENDVNVSNCSWTPGSLPVSYGVGTTNEAKTLSVWIRNSDATSTRVDSNTVTLDTVDPTVTLGSLTGGQTIAGGVTTSINWSGVVDANLGTTPISLEVSSDSGSTWSPIASALSSAVTGSYSWSVPSVTSSTYRVRVTATDLAGNSTSDSSSSDFLISMTAIIVTVTAPSGGELLRGGSTQNITWTASNLPVGSSTAELEYSLNNGSSWTQITASTANSSSNTYSWTLPSADSTQARVRVTVTDSLSNQTADSSDSNFTIDSTAPSAPSALTLITPASSPATSATPTIRISGVVSGDSVKLFTNSSCSVGNQIASGTASGTTIDLTTSSLAIGSYTLYANSTDPAGNVSSCSSASVGYQRVSPIAVLDIASNTVATTTVGAQSSAVTFNVTNTGTGPATLAASTPSTLTTGTDFTITGGTCIASATVAVNGSCTITVRFNPTASGIRLDTLNLSYNDGSANQIVTEAIGGVANSPASLAFAAASYDFGSSIMGASTASLTLTVTNSGQSTATSLSAGSFTVGFSYESGSYPGLSGGSACGSTLAAGASCTIKLLATAGNSPGYDFGKYGQQYNLSYHNGAQTMTASTLLAAEGFSLQVATYPVDWGGCPVGWGTCSGGIDYTSTHVSLDFGTLTDASPRAYKMVTFINPSSTSYVVADSNNISTQVNGTLTGEFGPAAPGGRTPSVSNPCGFHNAGATIPANSSCTQPYYFEVSGSSGGLPPSFALIQHTVGTVTIEVAADMTTKPACSCNPADSVNFGGGTGTSGNPWQICSVAHWTRINTNMDGSGWSGKYFQQCADIDFGGSIAPSIGSFTGKFFSGYYDGNHYQLQDIALAVSYEDCWDGSISSSYNLLLGCPVGFSYRSTDSAGLFVSLVGTGVIKNLGVNEISVGTGTMDTPFGAIMGNLSSTSTAAIDNVWVAGATIDPEYDDGTFIAGQTACSTVGGLVGEQNGGGIVNSQFEGTVIGGVNVGGLVGAANGGGIALQIKDSSAHSTTITFSSALVGTSGVGGGLVGTFSGTASSLQSSFFHGSVGSNLIVSDLILGGVIGQSSGKTHRKLGAYGTINGSGGGSTFTVGGIVGSINSPVSTGTTYENLQFDGSITGDLVGSVFGQYIERSGIDVSFLDLEARAQMTSNSTGVGGIGGSVARLTNPASGTFSLQNAKVYGSISGSSGGTNGIVFGSYPSDSSIISSNILAIYDSFTNLGGIIGNASTGSYKLIDLVAGVQTGSGTAYCGPSGASFTNIKLWQDSTASVSGRLQNLNGLVNGSSSCGSLSSSQMQNLSNFSLGSGWFVPGLLWPFPSF